LFSTIKQNIVNSLKSFKKKIKIQLFATTSYGGGPTMAPQEGALHVFAQASHGF
jgi:hypothetical protein